MIDYLLFWIMKPLGELAGTVVLLAGFAAVYLIFYVIREWVKWIRDWFR